MPTLVQPGHFELSRFKFHDQSVGLARASRVKLGIIQGPFQFLSASFGSQNGGFHPLEFALFFERQFSRTIWFGPGFNLRARGLGSDRPGGSRGAVPLLLFFEVIGIVAWLNK